MPFIGVVQRPRTYPSRPYSSIMSHGPGMNPELYNTLKQKLQSLDAAPRMPIPDGTNPPLMKNCILRVAAELGIPVTIRRVPGGLLFWRSADEDLQQAKEIAK
jgi:hypothetical protein